MHLPMRVIPEQLMLEAVGIEGKVVVCLLPSTVGYPNICYCFFSGTEYLTQ